MNQKEAIAHLKERVKPGSVVYTDVVHVSRSGMLRKIRLFIIEDSQPIDISYLTGLATETKQDKDTGALRVTGCGMDMGFAVVYELSHRLYSNGFECTGDGTRTNDTGEWCLPCCPSNDHSNGDRDYTPHWHSSGGYALKQRWL